MAPAELRRVQRLVISRAGDAIFCEGDNRPTHKLNLESGESLSTEQGVSEINESPFAPIAFMHARV